MPDKRCSKTQLQAQKEELLPQPTLVKKEQSLMGKKCGKEFGAWNGGIMYALYEVKNCHWNGHVFLRRAR